MHAPRTVTAWCGPPGCALGVALFAFGKATTQCNPTQTSQIQYYLTSAAGLAACGSLRASQCGRRARCASLETSSANLNLVVTVTVTVTWRFSTDFEPDSQTHRCCVPGPIAQAQVVHCIVLIQHPWYESEHAQPVTNAPTISGSSLARSLCLPALRSLSVPLC